MNREYELVAARRWWGVRMVAVWACPERPAIAVPAPAPQVTVIHVHIHAPVPAVVGQAPRIIQATPEREAITEGETE